MFPKSALLAALLVVGVGISYPLLADEDAHGMLYPWVSPDGRQIAFSYQGDIWVVSSAGGVARRLTVSVAFERSPRWSPDGAWIVFASNRDGNYDLYLTPSAGGETRRLTYSDASDYPGGWSPDGRKVLFTTYRHFPGSQMMEIDVETGTERLILWDSASLRYPRYSPDGSRILFNRGPSSYTRLGYRGAANSQLWVMDAEGRNARRLDDWDGGQHWGEWSADGDTIYYATDRRGRRSLYAVSSDGGTPKEVLKFADKDIFYPSVASDGTAVVWADGQLYRGRVSPDGLVSEPVRLSIQAGSDYKRQYVTREVFHTASEVVASPDGKWLALVIRGDVYVQPVSRTPEEEVDAPRGGEAVNFTCTPGREWQVQWHPEGDRLIMLSDKDGDQNIYQLDLNLREWKRLTCSREVEISPRLSPDGKKLAFYRGDGDLIVLDLETMRERRLFSGMTRRGVWATSLEWSPDSAWLAYTDITPAWHRDIWLLKADGSVGPCNVTKYPVTNWGQQWTADGKNLVFASNREGDMSRLFVLPLRPEKVKFSDVMKFGRSGQGDAAAPEDRQGAAPAVPPAAEAVPAQTAPATGEESEAEGEEKPQPVAIDFRNIEYRAKAVSEALENINNFALSPDGKTCLYQAGMTLKEKKLWAVDLLTAKSSYVGIAEPLKWLSWTSPAGPYGIYESGQVVKFEVNGFTITGVTPVPVTARTVLDRPAELRGMYDEAYRNLKYGFYDPALHGRDMDTAYLKYRRMVERAVTHEEFDLFVSLLLGELNASHLGVWGEESFEGIGASVGNLGVLFDTSYPGPGMKVARVLELGPSDRDESRLHPGEVILEVEGVALGPNEALHRALEGTAGRTVKLSVQRADGTTETVLTRPIPSSDQRNLEYEQWVRDNRARVEQLSQGRVAYLHIRAMDEESLYRFERELFGYAMDFEAVVIDVRYNGGGHIHEELFERLGRRPFGYITRRNSGKLIQPADMHPGPKVCLIHESSFSDAEIFPYGFRRLGYGQLVGMPTFGGVIGTRNYELLDGTVFRIPMTGWWRLDGSNMENSPTEPDVWVDAAPGEIPSGEDPQLKRAVEVVLAQLM